MSRYYYPSAPDALSAKKMFLREHGYKIPHCFQNTWGTGYVLFDSKADVNSWYKEHTGEPFFKEEYEPGTIFTKNDALQETEQSYGGRIDEVLRYRNSSKPILAQSGRFTDANGDESEGTVIKLREVDFGGLKLKNVRAFVVRNQKTLLLLGQSELGRLGKIEIDNHNKKLIINPCR